MAQTGDDCFFFYNQACNKGSGCKFRHVEEAKGSEVVCSDWRLGRCTKISCPYRHSEPPKPCYYESQPGGCTRINCQFAHQFPKTGPAGGAPVFSLQPPVSVPSNIRPGWAPPGHPALPLGVPLTSVHNWTPPQGPLAARPRFMPPPIPGVPFSQFPQGPTDAVYTVDQAGDKVMPTVDPVIINLNSEESDQDSVKGASPQKPVSRTIVAPVQTQSDNPLDYFLNAKPWVDPRRRRTPSPRRSSPLRSRSPSPRSPGRSPSPTRSISPVGRRRSVSVDRQPRRQRSHSLDRSRSQSPDARDRRRFVRRSSRSPPRRRSRSPGPSRGRPVQPDLRSKLKPQVPKGPKFEEVKVTGPKIISIKKDKKEDEAEKTEEQTEKANEEDEPKGFVQDEVKSLEEIYRERALKSLMDAKRKRILEQKKKRWEALGEKTSESEPLVNSESEKPVEDSENKGEQTAEEEQSESEDSEADLADDVDVEIAVGELEEEDQEKESEVVEKPEDTGSEEEQNGKSDATQGKQRKAMSSVAKAKPANKPSVKSRLGQRAVEQALKDRIGAPSSRARSIKDRLGLKTADDSAPGLHTVRSGVIRLSKSSSDLSSKVRDMRDVRARKAVRSRDKELLLLPQITIRNNLDVEQRRAGIKQRLGLIPDGDSDGRRKKNDMDEELLKLLQEEDMDIDEEDIKLLTKKEKKRLLKKLLIEHGREDEYELFKKRKKKARRKDRDDEEESSRRKINVHSRLGPSPVRESEEEAENQLDSGEEIELAEEEREPEGEEALDNAELEVAPESSNSKENVPSADNAEGVKVPEEEQREKARRLKDALEPKTLEDIRRERAEKKARGELDSLRVTSRKGRRIMIADDPEDANPPKSDPPVKVTFGEDDVLQRKLGQKTSVWSRKDPQERSARRERQIYVPPSVKRADGPVLVTKKNTTALKRAAEPPAGRDIVDYGDMFPKKSTSTETVTEPKAKTVKIFRSAEQLPETRAPIKLQRGPPKVEIKDATVKTFAEIMAEKRRKRQLAQQANSADRKPFTPITFDEPDLSSQDSATSFKGDKPKSSIMSRLSPFEDASSNDSTSQSFTSQSVSSSPVKRISTSSPVTTNVPQKSAKDEITSGKPSRWKRRRTNPDSVTSASTAEDNEVLKTQETVPSASTENSSVQKTLSHGETEKTEKVVPRKSSVDAPAAARKSKTESTPVPEKKKKLSDSFLDLDDDFLNMDNDDDLDLDLAANQDHDELMKEIDELLA